MSTIETINTIAGGLNTVTSILAPTGQIVTAPTAIITQVGAASHNDPAPITEPLLN